MKEKESHDLKNEDKKSIESTPINEVDVNIDDEDSIESQDSNLVGEEKKIFSIPKEWEGKPESEIILLREIQDLKKKLEESEKVWFDKYARLQAEFENFQRRNLKDKDNYIKYVSSDLISKLLPVIDSFEIMLKSLEQKLEPKEFQGIQMIFKELMKVFEKEGLIPIKAKGTQFDPFVHEILIAECTDECPENTILEEFQKGYKLKDRVLRPSKVKIAKSKKDQEEKKEIKSEELNDKEIDKKEKEGY